MISDNPASGKGRIAAIGMFDGLHRGHRHLISQLLDKSACKGLAPLAVTFPDHPLRYIKPEKCPKLLTPESAEKARLLQEAGVDRMLSLAFTPRLRQLTAAEFMRWLRENYDVREIVIGYDHRFGSDRLERLEDYRRAGKEAGVVVTGATPFLLPEDNPSGKATAEDRKVSSSVIRRTIERGDMERAALLLGRRYEISGTVETGDRLGRKLGVPTANLHISSRQCMPPDGVYAALAVLPDGKYFPSVVNLGHRPTVSSKLGSDYRVEAHIIGFDGDLYGQKLSLIFIKRLRSEIKFNSLDELKAQIQKDIALTLAEIEEKN